MAAVTMISPKVMYPKCLKMPASQEVRQTMLSVRPNTGDTGYTPQTPSESIVRFRIEMDIQWGLCQFQT